MITIRPATRADLPQLQELAIATCIHTFGAFNTPENMAFYLKEAYDMAQLEKEWNETGTLYSLACEGETLIGFSRVRESDEAEPYLGKNTIELQRLYIHPDHQGKKAGSRLMQLAIDQAGQQGRHWIWLGVWERNYNAQKFYAQWGFEKFAEHIFPMGDDPQTDWMMKRKLVSSPTLSG